MLATSIAALDGQPSANMHMPAVRGDNAKAMAVEIPRTTSPIHMSASPFSARSFGVIVDDTAYGQSISSVMQASEFSCEFSEQSLSMSVDSDYLPKLEEDFCRNFFCCGVYLENLHQLQNHYEAEHSEEKSSRSSSTSSNKSSGAISTPASSIHSDLQSQKVRLAHSSHTTSSSMPGTPMMDMEIDDGSTVAANAIPRSFSAGMNCVTPNMLHPAAMARQQQQQQHNKAVPFSMSTPMSGFYAQASPAQTNPSRRTPFAPLQPQPPRSTASTYSAMATGLSSQSQMNYDMNSNANKNIPLSAAVQPSAQAPIKEKKEERDRDKPYKCPVPVS